jgi:hypothetical protein
MKAARPLGFGGMNARTSAALIDRHKRSGFSARNRKPASALLALIEERPLTSHAPNERLREIDDRGHDKV